MKLPVRSPLQELSRRGALTAFAITLAALVVAATWFIHTRTTLRHAFASLGEHEQQLADASSRQQEAQLKLQYAQSAQRLMAAAQQRGLQPDAWGERVINVRQGQFGREETANLVAATARSRGSLFGAETFELSVTRPDESLFVVPSAPMAGAAATPLSLSLSGSLLFRTGTDTDAADVAAPTSKP